MIVLSMNPARKAMDTSNTVYTNTFNPNYDFVLPFFFENGIDTLDVSEKDKLLELIDIFMTCGEEEIEVIGYASSRAFEGFSNSRNTQLANDRAKNVKSYIEAWTNSSVNARNWNDYEEMESFRRITDRDLQGNLISRSEKLNRRVEVVWSNNKCYRND
ncbi:OmpA family protein [Neolewinella aurantiaca]|nr:OmpA family protein [Neolewinella aurantiaca]